MLLFTLFRSLSFHVIMEYQHKFTDSGTACNGPIVPIILCKNMFEPIFNYSGSIMVRSNNYCTTILLSRSEEWLIVTVGDNERGTWAHLTSTQQQHQQQHQAQHLAASSSTCASKPQQQQQQQQQQVFGSPFVDQAAANQWDVVPSILIWLRIFEHPFVQMHGWPWPICGSGLVIPTSLANDASKSRGQKRRGSEVMNNLSNQ